MLVEAVEVLAVALVGPAPVVRPAPPAGRVDVLRPLDAVRRDARFGVVAARGAGLSCADDVASGVLSAAAAADPTVATPASAVSITSASLIDGSEGGLMLLEASMRADGTPVKFAVFCSVAP